jgi:hypothetical protein
MSSLTSPAGAVHLGMDTSKNTIVVATLMPGEEVPVIDRMWNEEGSVRHLVGRFSAERRCGPVTRLARAALSCTGCLPRWGWPVIWWPRR